MPGPIVAMLRMDAPWLPLSQCRNSTFSDFGPIHTYWRKGYDDINLIKFSPFPNKPFTPRIGYASFSESNTGNVPTNNPRRSAARKSIFK